MEEKILIFLSAIQDCYKDEEERELDSFSKIDIKSTNLTEDFTAMIYAMKVFYENVTAGKTDTIGFTHIINRLVYQDILERKGENNE